MNRSWAELPVEILQCIFINLSKRDLSHSQQVCTGWSGTARKIFYQHVEIGMPHVATKYIRTIMESQDCIGHLVKSINVYTFFTFGDSFSDVDEKFFNCIVKLCPNLKKLAAYNPSTYFWRRLLEQTTKYGLSLERIPTDASWNYDLYSRVALFMRSTLQQVYLYDPQLLSVYGTDEALDRRPHPFLNNPLVIALNQFPHLTVLEIEIRTNSSIYSFDRFIEKCPLLESLKLKIFPISRENPKNEMDIYLTNDRDNKLNLDLIQPHLGIKQLKGHIPFYTSESIKYFLHKFPRLNKLDMNWRTDNSELTEALASCRETIDEQDFQLKYFERILKIPSFNVHNISFKNPANLLARFIRHTKFSGMLDIGYENSDDTYWVWDTSNRNDLRIQIHNDQDRWVTNLESKPTITAHYDADENHRFLMDDRSQDIPHYRLIQEIGGYIQHLRLTDFYKKLVCISTRPEDKKKHVYMSNGKHLEDILGQCPHLKSLIINYWDTIGFTDNEGVLNESLEELSFSFCKLDTKVLSNYSARLPNLKRLNLARNHLVNSALLECKIHMPHTWFDSIVFFMDVVLKEDINENAIVGGDETVVVQDIQQHADMEEANSETVFGEEVVNEAEEVMVMEAHQEEEEEEENAVAFDDEDFVIDDEDMMEEDEDMVYTVDGDDLNTVSIETFYVKLVVNGQEKWYRGDGKNFRATSSEAYHNDESGYGFLFDFECKALSKLIVEFQDHDTYQKCELDKII